MVSSKSLYHLFTVLACGSLLGQIIHYVQLKTKVHIRFDQLHTDKRVNSSVQFSTYSENDFTNGRQYVQEKQRGLPRIALIAGQGTSPPSSDDKHRIFVLKPVHWLDDYVGPTRWETSQVFQNCPVSNCILSKQTTYMDQADVVIFRPRSCYTCRKKIKLGQIWVIMEHEAPYGTYSKCFRNTINWTMTYRRDSDFTLVHGQFKKSAGYDEANVKSLIKSKMNVMVGFISNCFGSSNRLKYIEKLRSYGIAIDIYGGCGDLKCKSKGNRYKAVWNSTFDVKDGCFDVLDSRYKFYLSFENSLCTDYVTEKSFHLILRHNIVPLIRSGSNHTLYHPPKSYIYTGDFKDVASLATHLKQLLANDDEYIKYYHWRKYYSSETIAGVLQTQLCNMCQRLQQPLKYQRLYNDFSLFLSTRANGSSMCHPANDIT